MQLMDSTIAYKGKIQELLRKTVYEQGKFEEYLQIHTSVKRYAVTDPNAKIPYVRVSHKELGKLLDIIHLSVQDMFKAVDEPIVLSEEDIAVLDAFKSLPSQKRNELIKKIQTGFFCKTWWMDNDAEHTYPAKKFRLVAKRRLTDEQRKLPSDDCLTQADIFIFQQKYRALPLEIMPRLSRVLGISVRWLMCIDENYPVYTDDPTVDTLFDLYKLLNESAKGIVMSTVKAAKGEA